MMHRKRHWVFSIERLTPAQVLGLGYFSVIVVGTLLLKLPIATRPGVELSVLDAAFTATSATCVTGLSVLNTATGFSRFGQTIIMILVQIGGLGIMTMSTLFALLLGKRIGIRQRQLIQEDLNNISVSGVVRMARLIIEIALIFEGIGAVILFLHWVGTCQQVVPFSSRCSTQYLPLTMQGLIFSEQALKDLWVTLLSIS